MSNKEKIVALLDNVPDYKMGYVLAYIQGLTADEEADDLFCERMIENYKNAPDEDNQESGAGDKGKNKSIFKLSCRR